MINTPLSQPAAPRTDADKFVLHMQHEFVRGMGK